MDKGAHETKGPVRRGPGVSQRGPGEPPEGEQPDRLAWKGALVVALVVGGLVVWRALVGSTAPPDAPSAPANAAEAGTEAPRCVAVAEPFVVGEVQRGGARAGGGGEDAIEEQLAPFAAEVGRGAAYEGGFAVGTMVQAEGGTVASVVTLRSDGTGGKIVRLARSRGDLDPPVVTGAGGAVLAAMFEPNAGGRAIRLARVAGEEVTWGAELSEGRDESLAVDIEVSGERAVIVWDDVTRDGKRSRIMMASMDTASMRSVTAARPISPPKVDAESPRLAARPGGYWLAYVARSEETPEKAKPEKAKPDPEDEDIAPAWETIGQQWIEVAPLDGTGSLTASPRAVTPVEGNVLAFDLAPGEDGGAIVAYREDDAPSGSSGGRVGVVLVGLGGVVGQPRSIAEEDVGIGVPSLVPGWIAVADVTGPTRLAAMSPRGEIVDGLAAEPAVRHGEPIAAANGALLVARPAGKAMRLAVLRCVAGTRRVAADDAGAPPAPDEIESPPVEEDRVPPGD